MIGTTSSAFNLVPIYSTSPKKVSTCFVVRFTIYRIQGTIVLFFHTFVSVNGAYFWGANGLISSYKIPPGKLSCLHLSRLPGVKSHHLAFRSST